MWNIDKAYIDGKFVPVHGDEVIETTNPSTEQVIGTATLANRDDARCAIAAAQRAQQTLARTGKAERIDMLMRLQTAVLASTERIRDATIDEYGGPVARAQWVSEYASQCFANTAKALDDYPLTRRVGDATVFMAPVGVAGLIAPWNSTAGTICSKLASAIAAGCASVIKPSELSPIQTMVVAEALHDAGLPPGVFNILLGRGADVGDEISTNPGVAKISFTGSTPTGKLIARAGLETMKRVSLSLTGKSASVLLDDADLDSAIPLALNAAFMNNGQACVAGTRLLVPRSRLDEVIEQVKAAVATMRVGDPRDPSTVVGPLVNRAQYDRVQHFIRRGIEQGALLVTGGEGRPAGLDKGYFVNPTVFAGVRNDMDIAREEIFGPVLSILEYENEDDAIRIANDSVYGLQAYVFSSQTGRAERVASQLEAGTVLINRIKPELLAPFGGLKQSGLGREFGVFGLEAFLEPKSIVSAE
ncbi:MAG: Aldehyde dehydrogenase (EC [uncultured Paraburkholderia sp.]|uniref:aldehyde dehydrogenase family protein n=1 Tax=uncultured Paraburkholderia sp. TaxID=1822466 RepID=UPI002599EF24|nr:aldehyde dehydrogenase family protein [uncultured Paraburkholderia sp.]CAH2902438.1 MAG: Aldehyde dehydrogenase (EC [uncultured Paraburkholderia sp.]CAH2937240.1 MAG: Aldehyde dehydrogenase (EC [uncultured Paraburkholderia sp.]